MKTVYPVIFTPDGEWFVVDVPDLGISTQGEGLADAIDMARDAINLTGVTLQDNGEPVPEPSSISSVAVGEGQIVTLVDCDFDEYRKFLENRSVKKNCTLPSWLNKKAEAAQINFSAVLQEALMEKLGLNQ
jgi:predicted RNase H-like HicB family nuclease